MVTQRLCLGTDLLTCSLLTPRFVVFITIVLLDYFDKLLFMQTRALRVSFLRLLIGRLDHCQNSKYERMLRGIFARTIPFPPVNGDTKSDKFKASEFFDNF